MWSQSTEHEAAREGFLVDRGADDHEDAQRDHDRGMDEEPVVVDG